MAESGAEEGWSNPWPGFFIMAMGALGLLIRNVQEAKEENGSLLIIPKNKQRIKEELWQAARDKHWQVAALEVAPVKLEEVFWDLTKQKTA